MSIIAIAAAITVTGCDRPAEFQTDWQPPGFTVIHSDGDTFRYPEDLERPTIVLFWATWCPYCKAVMPHLQSILEEYPGQVDVVALTIREDGDPAALLAEYGYDFRLVEDADRAAEMWGVKGTPGLFLADASGRVVFDRMRIPPEAAAAASGDVEGMKHYQKAARGAPFWAARLRRSLDLLLD
ncbi:TlpA family protein disulfide reductase [Elongatibacter sediminis]|uniref:TlpA disulfide reductase family protein n=1 Tax=Elongatibacter sediminis TaxID=3119006 RepID=A0AAW9R6W0_9GAMM